MEVTDIKEIKDLLERCREKLKQLRAEESSLFAKIEELKAKEDKINKELDEKALAVKWEQFVEGKSRGILWDDPWSCDFVEFQSFALEKLATGAIVPDKTKFVVADVRSGKVTWIKKDGLKFEVENSPYHPSDYFLFSL